MSSQDVGDEKNALLVDNDVHELMQYLVRKGKLVITPELDANGIHYPIFSSIFPNKKETEVAQLLEKLATSGLLKFKLLDKVIVCPTCGSPQVHSKYNCPRCNSFDIGKAPIIEHTRCGYIGSKEKFVKANILVCPKCKNDVGMKEYKNIGTSFECNSCGSRFESPKISHKCDSCEDVFTYKEARYEPVRAFELTEDAKRNVAKGTLPLESIMKTMEENGFEVGLRSRLIGKSGATHNFDLIARKGRTLVVANFAFEPREEDIIGLFAKKYDVNPTFTVLVALSPPTKEEDAVSKAYDVKVVTPSGSRSIGEELVHLVNSASSGSLQSSDENKKENLESNDQMTGFKRRNDEYLSDQESD